MPRTDLLRVATLFAISASLALAACGDTGPNETPDSLPTDTLATTISDSADLSNFATLLNQAELGSVFDGRGVYTVLAPVDAAFGEDGDPSQRMSDDRARALLVAALRRQILPGYVTIDAIERALEGQDKVQMRTLGEGLVTFTRDGDAIRVESADGRSARITGEVTPATNGAILPIDGLLELAAS